MSDCLKVDITEAINRNVHYLLNVAENKGYSVPDGKIPSDAKCILFYKEHPRYHDKRVRYSEYPAGVEYDSSFKLTTHTETVSMVDDFRTVLAYLEESS